MRVFLIHGDDHAGAVANLRAVLPDVRWIASYATKGSHDFVDVLHLEDDEVQRAREAFESAGLQVDVLDAEPSELLRAPGA